MLPTIGQNTVCWTMKMSSVIAVWLTVYWVLPIAQPQQTDGFISINCGGHSFKDRNTGIDWSTDKSYLRSVDYLLEKGAAQAVNVTAAVAQQELRSTMVFFTDVIPWSKFCYTLPVENQLPIANYLVRVTLPSSTMLTKFPLHTNNTGFALSVDVTIVTFVELHPTETQEVELVVTSVDETIYICVIANRSRSSLAALSSIELRPLPRDLYADGRTKTGESPIPGSNQPLKLYTYLMTLARVNCGGYPVRFPLDPYDRKWQGVPDVMVNAENMKTENSNFSNNHPNVRYPNLILQSAWVMETKSFPDGSKSTPIVRFRLNVPRWFDLFYVPQAFYNFYTNNDGSNLGQLPTILPAISFFHEKFAGYPTELVEDGVPIFSNMSSMLWTAVPVYTIDGVTLSWVLNPIGPPVGMVNALEVFGEFRSVMLKKDKFTYDFLHIFLSAYGFTITEGLDMSGDPCLPVPWAWLTCTESAQLYQMCGILSNGKISERLSESSLHSLYLLRQFLWSSGYDFSIDISNNNLSGRVPLALVVEVRDGRIDLGRNNFSSFDLTLRTNSLRCIYHQPGVCVMYLQYNSFTTEALWPLLSSEISQTVRSLNVANNKLTGPIPAEIGNMSVIEELDLSHYYLSGHFPPELFNLTMLRMLDVSHNGLTGSIHADLVVLNYLDLSSNRLSGQIPSELVESSFLTTLKLQNNRFTGAFPGQLWSTTTQNISINEDNNKIQKLNLTKWCGKLQKTQSYSSFKQKIWLTRNEISLVVLPDECRKRDLHSTAGGSTQNHDHGFILLGQNPWCTHLGYGRRTQVERYLCRSNPLEDFWTPDVPRSNAISRGILVLLSVVGGLLILSLSLILLIISLRYRNRLRVFRQIQEDLAKDDVRPPFWKYERLKAATRNFSKENELGKGAFGAVYKGVHVDGTIFAVKQLFPTTQNMTDFLKEMVLSAIKHKNLVQLKGCCVRDDKRLLVYEFVENNNLADALWGDLEHGCKLTWRQRLQICSDIAKGLSYLHQELQPKIIHRDIKPQNILLDRNWNAKIADFGLARPVNEDLTQKTMNIGGTRGYLSPERAALGIVSEKLDVYSYGILILEIVSGRHCIDPSLSADEFYIRDWAVKLLKEERLEDVADKKLLTSTSEADIRAVLNMAMACVQEKPERRPTMSQVVTMLAGQCPELAMDIMSEIRDQQRLHSDLLLSASTTVTTVKADEETWSESSAFLGSIPHFNSRLLPEMAQAFESTSKKKSPGR